MYKVQPTQAAGEQNGKLDSESLMHIMTVADRRAPWNTLIPEQGRRRGERITQVCAVGESWQLLSINFFFPSA